MQQELRSLPALRLEQDELSEALDDPTLLTRTNFAIAQRLRFEIDAVKINEVLAELRHLDMSFRELTTDAISIDESAHLPAFDQFGLPIGAEFRDFVASGIRPDRMSAFPLMMTLSFTLLLSTSRS